ncbi:MAG: hypothetical protein HZC01_00660 [Candidatus Kerfeldbacteria bacterium]|nr:hypothetical protein [Candidatus Kerfeldbacteria bacterium]
MCTISMVTDEFWRTQVKGVEVLISRVFTEGEAKIIAEYLAADGEKMHCGKPVAERISIPRIVSSAQPVCVFINFPATSEHGRQIQIRKNSAEAEYVV